VGDDVLKVGELASRTGLSVRALHHYDEIGLLRPRHRTRSGHRVYGLEEVRRLQQIASLRGLGLSLEEIRDCLDRSEFTLERVLALQIERLRTSMARQAQLVELLEGIRRKAEGGEPLTVDDIASAIEGTLRLERYFTPEQRAALAGRAEELGAAGLQRAQDDWAELFSALDEARRAGVPPADARVQALAARARDLVRAFTGGDPGIQASLERMYREGEGVEEARRRGMGVAPELWEYYGQVMKAGTGKASPGKAVPGKATRG